MKKIIVFFLFTAQAFAQEQLSVLNLTVSIPIEIKGKIYSGGNLDSTYVVPGWASAGIGSTVSLSFSYQNNRYSYDYSEGYGPDYHQNCSFTLDTLHNQLKNFIYYYQINRNYASYPHYGYTDHIQFSSLSYTINGDTLIVKPSGLECIKALDSAFYIGNYTTTPPPYYTSKDENSNRILYEDTADFRCSINILLQRNSNVSTNKNFHQTLQTFSLSGSQINFFCQSFTSSQTLFIYDILGREVSKIVVPAGSTSYQISSASFPKGTYFARLGESIAHFQVY